VYALLSGMRIVEGSAFVAAPLGGMTLAQLGADVIRFDDVRGGIDYGRWPLASSGRSIYWASMNKGKRSFAVNLRETEGRELVAALIATGDEGGMFLTNMPMRRELDIEALKARRADVIALQITGHSDGQTALDYTVNAAVGFPAITGNASADDPINAVLPAWDLSTGLTAATGLLAAERHRRMSGQGQHIRLALSDVGYAAAANLGYIGEWQLNGEHRGALGNDLYGAFGRDFPTSDGRRVMIAAISLRQWHGLVRAIEGEEKMVLMEQIAGADFNDEGDRYEARDLIGPIVERWTSGHTLEEVGQAFDANGVCWGPYQTFGQMVDDDPRCSEANPLFSTVEHPQVGTFLTPGSPLFMGALERQPPGPAPVLGQHTDAILGDILRLPEHEIGRLHDTGMVASAAV
jgi:2-methylfumaryl-CoA isomerase